MDEIIHDKFGFHIFEPIARFETYPKVKPHAILEGAAKDLSPQKLHLLNSSSESEPEFGGKNPLGPKAKT